MVVTLQRSCIITGEDLRSTLRTMSARRMEHYALSRDWGRKIVVIDAGRVHLHRGEGIQTLDCTSRPLATYALNTKMHNMLCIH